MKYVIFSTLLCCALFAAKAQEGTYPIYSIAQVRGNDADGRPDSISVKCQLQAIVYGGNLRSIGLEFAMIDNVGDGIRVFSSMNNFGYAVTEGDSVVVRGAISFFNGLTQITADTVWRVSQNNPLRQPQLVTALSEATESRLIRIENVRLSNPAQWTSAGAGFNVTLTNDVDTFVMRIDAEVDIFGQLPPTGTFNVTGIGTQFDNSAPFNSGYQIQPRYKADIAPYNTANPFPRYNIGVVRTNDANGRPDSLGVRCELVGVVHGPNFRTSGLQFTIIGSDGKGISVFNNNNTLGYTVTEGDDIAVRGEIGFFNGLTQINASAIDFRSAGNPLATPQVTDVLNENTESQMVRLLNVSIKNPAEWTNMGTAFNVTVTNGTQDFTMRISNQTNVFGTAAPTGVFNLTGIGSQFDNSTPFNDGYQIFPRYLADFEGVSATLDPTLAQGLRVYPNPVADWLTLESPQGFDRIRISNLSGQPVFDLKATGAMQQIDLSRLSSGIYTLTLMRGSRLWSLQIVRQ
jgi:hypothetical protein